MGFCIFGVMTISVLARGVMSSSSSVTCFARAFSSGELCGSEERSLLSEGESISEGGVGVIVLLLMMLVVSSAELSLAAPLLFTAGVRESLHSGVTCASVGMADMIKGEKILQNDLKEAI